MDSSTDDKIWHDMQKVQARAQHIANMQTPKFPVTLVEHMTDPRAAQLQMLFASLDERGKKTLIAMAAAMARLHKDGYHG